MQTTTSRLTSGTETGTDFATWRTADLTGFLALQQALLAAKRPNRIPTRRERQAVIALRDQLAAELDRRPTEIVEARDLRDGDVIVNSADGKEIPVLLATLYGGLIMIWTDTVNGFAMSPSLVVEIKRRNGGDENDNRDFAAVREPSVYEDPAVLDAIFGASRNGGA